MIHTIEFRTIDYESRTTKHLIDWYIDKPLETVIPRTGEFIMLPKDSTACAKRYKYEIKNILWESFDRIVCYVVECNCKDINFRTDEEVSSKSSEKNRKKI